MQSTTRPGFSNLLSAMFVNGRGKRRRLSSTARSSSIESLELRTLLTNVTADITTSQTWTAAGSPYILQNSVSIRNGATLTIGEGVQVRAASTSYVLNVGQAGETGVLNSIASTANGVTFSTNLSVSSSGTATIARNRFDSGRLVIQSGSNVTLTGNSFHSGKTESTTPIWIDPELVPILEGTPASPNIFAANTQVGILAGTIDSPGVVWKKLGLNEGYRLLYNDDVVVANGGSLTIDSSNTISREGDLSEIYVRNAGSFNAANVQLDSVIEFQANSTATLSNNSLTAGRFQIQSGSNVTLTGNSFHSGKTESTTPIWIDPELVPILEGTPASPNIFAANTQVGILAGTIDSPGVVWKKLGLNEGYRLLYNDDVVVANGGSLTIDSSNTISREGDLSEIYVRNAGSFNAANVQLDSVIEFQANSTATLSNNSLTAGRFQIQSGSNVTLTGNSFHSGKTESTTPIWIDPELVPILEGTPASPNIFAANTQVGILAGTIDSPGVVWKKLGLNEGYRLLYNDDVVVANGGSLTIDSSNTISREGDLSEIYVRNAGRFSSTGNTISVPVVFQSGSDGRLERNLFTGSIDLRFAGAIPESPVFIRRNDFRGVNQIFADGTSAQSVNLTSNFWGSLTTNEIENKVTHRNDNSSLPLAILTDPMQPNTLGGRVWTDTNRDGLQAFHPNEAGVSAVSAQLFFVGGDGNVGGSDDVLLQSTVTDTDGNYSFVVAAADVSKRLFVKFTGLPINIGFTTQDVGGSDFSDSDPFSTGVKIGATNFINMTGGLVSLSHDAGLVDNGIPALSLTINPVSISEGGGNALGTVTLGNALTSPLTVNLTSSDLTAATVPASVTIPAGLTSATFSITAVNDAIADGTQTTEITAAATGLTSVKSSLSVTDDDSRGFLVSSISRNTTELGGTATFTVALTSQPTAIVTIPLSSSDVTEGSVSPSTLTFTAANWNIAQVVTVTGVNDDVVDGNVSFSIDTGVAVGGDYAGLNAIDVAVTNVDDDPPPTVTLSRSNGAIAEADGTSLIVATLSTSSNLPITIDLGFAGTATLTSDYTRTATQIVIAAGQTSGSVTLAVVQDMLDEIDETIIIDITSVTNGTESTPQQATVTITDDDLPPTVTLSRSSGTVAEAAGVSILTATLSAASSLPVTINLDFAGTATPTGDYLITATQIVVQPGQTTGSVTITASQDQLDEVDETIIVDATNVSNGAEVTPQQATITIVDDDTRGVSVSLVSGSTSESGGTATFTVVLTSQPTSDVTISLTSSDTTEGVVIPTALNFTTVNWSSAQTVTITGVDDSLDDGNIDFQIVTGAALGGDYDGFLVADVSVTNVDNDFPTITVSVVPGTRPSFSWNVVSGFSQFDILASRDPSGIAVHQATVNGTLYTAPIDFGIGAYGVWVRGTNSAETTPWTPKKLFIVNTAARILPTTPTQLTARPTLRWEVLLGASKYDLWLDNRTTGQVQYVRNQNIAGTSWTPSTDLPLGSYRAWVRGIDAAGLAALWSTSVDFTVSTPVVLSPIAAIQATSRPTVSWSPVAGAAKYDLWIDNKTTGQAQYVRNQNLTTASWTSPADMPISVYRIWVRAIDSKGVAAPWSVAKDFAVGPAPVITSPLNSTFNRKPTFTWNAVSGATKYQVQVRNLTTGLTVYDQKSITTTNWTPPANLPDGPYRWWVVASGAGNVQGLWTAPVDFRVGGLVTILGPAGTTTNTRPTFSWRPVDGAARYELWVTNSATNTQVINQTNLTSLNYTAPAPLPKGNYRVWVRAVSTSGEVGVWSVEVQFTIAADEAAPQVQDLLSPLSDELLVVFRPEHNRPKLRNEQRSTDNTRSQEETYLDQERVAVSTGSAVLPVNAEDLKVNSPPKLEIADLLIDLVMASVDTNCLLEE